jgi:hypothetical protein
MKFSAMVFFSFEETPFFIFVMFKNKDLILEFGDEITIKTDCERVLPKKDDDPALHELRLAVFNAARHTEAFLNARQKANC